MLPLWNQLKILQLTFPVDHTWREEECSSRIQVSLPCRRCEETRGQVCAHSLCVDSYFHFTWCIFPWGPQPMVVMTRTRIRRGLFEPLPWSRGYMRGLVWHHWESRVRETAPASLIRLIHTVFTGCMRNTPPNSCLCLHTLSSRHSLCPTIPPWTFRKRETRETIVFTPTPTKGLLMLRWEDWKLLLAATLLPGSLWLI